MMIRNATFLGLLICTGCGPSDQVDTAEEGNTITSVELAFEMDEDFQTQIESNGDQALGTFYGSVFLASDVTALGPNPGVESLLDLELEVDLSVDNPTPNLIHTEAIPAGIVAILGFLDTDDNADATAPEPEAGDPVTLVGENKFEVMVGETTSVTIYFGFLHP